MVSKVTDGTVVSRDAGLGVDASNGRVVGTSLVDSVV